MSAFALRATREAILTIAAAGQVMLAELPALDRLILRAEAGEELPAEDVARVLVVLLVAAREAVAATAMIAPVAPTPAVERRRKLTARAPQRFERTFC